MASAPWGLVLLMAAFWGILWLVFRKTAAERDTYRTLADVRAKVNAKLREQRDAALARALARHDGDRAKEERRDREVLEDPDPAARAARAADVLRGAAGDGDRDLPAPDDPPAAGD